MRRQNARGKVAVVRGSFKCDKAKSGMVRVQVKACAGAVGGGAGEEVIHLLVGRDVVRDLRRMQW
jgi:hypothetical protein